MQEVDKMKRMIKSAIKLCVFLIFASLPFISITEMLGLDTFLDSFENPDHYLCIQDNGNLFGSKTNTEKYIIIQKSSHPNFKVSENDYVIYVESDGSLNCDRVNHIISAGSVKKYNFADNAGIASESIFENQIVGKVVDVIDNSIWSLMTIKIWDI